MKKFAFSFFCLLLAQFALAQTFEPNWTSLEKRKMPAWFQQSKFGIFIHWGVYAVPSYAPVIPNSGESYAEWYWNQLESKKPNFVQFHKKNYGDSFPYPAFEKQFKAEMFEPNQWADIFKRSGARYVVLTSKHHEGYCLWNSAEADRDWGRPWNAVTGTPKRDLLGDLSKSVRDAGLRMGYYYSLYEWFNPLWLTDKKRYVEEHMIPQFKDLVTKYKPSIIFSDGEWDLSDTAWHSPELLAWLFNESPVAKEVVVDDRWGGNTRGKHNGPTYATSEYGSGMDASVVWEENQGIGHSYGYNRNEQIDDYKSSRDLILMLIDIVSRGGNLLLDIGPTADGRIPVIMQQRLLDIGHWLDINGDAIYNSSPYSRPYQWSKGKLPNKKEANYMAGYSITKMLKEHPGQAHIEAFFTTKGKDLYCILPKYVPSLFISDIKVPAGASAMLLGNGKKIPITNLSNGCRLDLSQLKAGTFDASLFGIKIQGAFK